MQMLVGSYETNPKIILFCILVLDVVVSLDNEWHQCPVSTRPLSVHLQTPEDLTADSLQSQQTTGFIFLLFISSHKYQII